MLGTCWVSCGSAPCVFSPGAPAAGEALIGDETWLKERARELEEICIVPKAFSLSFPFIPLAQARYVAKSYMGGGREPHLQGSTYVTWEWWDA